MTWLCDDRIDCKKPCKLQIKINVLNKPRFCPFDGTPVAWVSKWLKKEIRNNN